MGYQHHLGRGAGLIRWMKCELTKALDLGQDVGYGHNILFSRSLFRLYSLSLSLSFSLSLSPSLSLCLTLFFSYTLFLYISLSLSLSFHLSLLLAEGK